MKHLFSRGFLAAMFLTVVALVSPRVTLADTHVHDILVDNSDSPGFTHLGWTSVTALTGFVGPNYRTTTTAGEANKARYTKTMPVAGYYSVYGWMLCAAGYNTAATYKITHADGVTTVTVNQSNAANSATWKLLGTFRFSATTPALIDVFAPGSGATARITTDAIRFSVAAPDVVLDSTASAPEVVRTGAWTSLAKVAGYGGSWYQQNLHNTSTYVDYKPFLPAAGEYDVWMWFPGIATISGVTYAAQVMVELRDTATSPETVIDPHFVNTRLDARGLASEGHWAYVGSYELPAGNAVKLRLRSDSSTGYVIADAVRFSKRAFPGGHFVLDNSAPTNTKTGSWSIDTSQKDKFGLSSEINATPASSNLFTFKPTLPFSGRFDIYSWAPEDVAYGGAVSFKVLEATGDYAPTVIQSQNAAGTGGRWRYLGNYELSLSNAEVVIDTLNAGGATVADAMMFAAEDSDFDGLPDGWEWQFGSLGFLQSGSDDADGDTKTNLEECINGTNPFDYYNGQTPTLTIHGGNNQTGPAYATLATSLKILVTNGGAPLVNAPVAFQVTVGEGRIYTQGGSHITYVEARTNAAGVAEVFWRLGYYGNFTNQVIAYAGYSPEVTFQAQSNALVAHWKLDEGSGSVAADSSGTGYAGIVGNGGATPWTTSFNSPAALKFLGRPEWGNIVYRTNNGYELLPGGQGPFSLALWFKTDLAAGEQGLYCLATNEIYLTRGFRLMVDSSPWFDAGSQQTQVMFWSTQSGGTVSLRSTQGIQPGTWYHLAVTYAEATPTAPATARMFLNGQEVASGPGTILSNTNPLYVGTGIGGIREFKGSIDDVHVYAKAINASEVGALNDADVDGLPDWWEAQFFGNLTQNGAGNPDGDGLTNLQEFNANSDPQDFYNGTQHVQLIAGGDQFGEPGAYAALPLVVEVRQYAGGPLLLNVPVKFTVTSVLPMNTAGGGLAASSGNASPVSQLTVMTDATLGRAQVYYKLPDSYSAGSVIRAQAGNVQGANNFVNFNLYTSKLMGNWKFDESSGDALDSSPSSPSNPGTLVGSPTRTESFDEIGGAGDKQLNLNGATQHVSVLGTSESLQFSSGNAFAVSAWIVPNPTISLVAITDIYPIVSKWTTSGGGFEFALKGGAAKGLSFRILSGGATSQTIWAATDQRALLLDGHPHHVAFSRNGAGSAFLYIDGVQVGSAISMAGSLTTSANLFLGKNAAASVNYFRGAMDDVKVFSSEQPGALLQGVYDSDQDGLPDWWERKYFAGLSASLGGDGDSDGLTNLAEYQAFTNPTDNDSDNDLVLDGAEVAAGRNPLLAPQNDPSGANINLTVYTRLE